jgi:Ca2+/Na+ antiporter
MIINSLRLLAVILLVIILIIKDIPFKPLFKDSMIQFYLALTCMVFLLFIDNIFGFILSICLLLLYFRVYTSELKNKKENKKEGDSSNSSDSSDSEPQKEHSKEHSKEHKHSHGSKSNETCEKCVMNMANINADKKISIPSQPTNNTGNSLVPYITEENLLAAQTNIVNPLEYNKETHGVDKGIYNEEVYGSQGLDTKNIHIRGYDTNNIYLGSLSYDIL